ncbi:GWxTD domain-containing protein [bacterium]|nr:GWxTD domain-containing protein [bacterium]
MNVRMNWGSICFFMFTVLISELQGAVTKSEVFTTLQDTSFLRLKSSAAADIKSYEELSGALQLLSKLFGDKLKSAEKNLKIVLEKDPDDIEAMFLMGIVLRYNGKLDESENLFKRVISKDDRFFAFDFRNVWLQLGYVYKESKKYELAVDAFKQGAIINLQDTWPLIELSDVFIDMNRPEEASEAFNAGLNDIKDSKAIERLFIDVQDIASKTELAQWENLKSNEEKLQFIRTFWKKRDPNPIDPVNQRLIEHYRRLDFARQSYGRPLKPWYDDRGLIYVRLGKPDRVYFGKPRQDIKENESWLYDNIKTGLYFDFVDVGSGYQLRSLIDAADKSASMEEIIGVFDERATLHPYYQQMAQKIRTQADVQRIRAENDLNNIQTGKGGANLVEAFERFEKSQIGTQFLGNNTYQQDYIGNEVFAQQNQHFVFDFGAPHLPMNVNFASFKGQSKNSRMEFYFIVPFEKLNFIPDKNQLEKYTSNLKLNLKIYDTKYNEITSTEREVTVNSNATELKTHFYLDQIEQELVPGKYVMAVEIRNNEKDRVGIYQFVVSVRDYTADTLTVSDIELAQYVDNTLVKDKFVKPQTTLKVVPNPAAGILKDKPLTVYYEIYNLTVNNEGKSSYQVSYSIKMLDTDQSFLSSIAGIFSSNKDASTSSVTVKEGKSTSEKEYIGFDISELPKGVARLEIKVKDLLSNKETVSGINLTIVEDDKATSISKSNQENQN